MHVQDYVRLLKSSDNTDIAAKLISDGLLRTEKTEQRKVAKLVRGKVVHAYMIEYIL